MDDVDKWATVLTASRRREISSSLLLCLASGLAVGACVAPSDNGQASPTEFDDTSRVSHDEQVSSASDLDNGGTVDSESFDRFDFGLTALEAFSSFDEMRSFADQAVRAVGIRGYVFDLSSSERDWVYKFGGTYVAAVSDPFVLMVVPQSFDLETELATNASEDGSRPSTASLDAGSAGVSECAVFTHWDAVWLVCGYQNVTMKVVARPGTDLSAMLDVMRVAVLHPVQIGDPDAAEQIDEGVSLGLISGADQVFPFSANPFGINGTEYPDGSRLLDAVDENMKSLGMNLHGFDVTAVSGVSRFFLIPSGVAALGESFAVVEQIGAATTAQLDETATEAQAKGYGSALLEIAGVQCLAVWSPARSALLCVVPEVSVQVIAPGVASDVGSADALNRLKEIMAEVLAHPISIPR